MSYSTAFTQGITLLLVIHSLQEKNADKSVATKFLAEHTAIPFPTAVKTLKGLSAAGILSTKEGAGGGSRLAKPLSEITLLDVFLAVEQDETLFKMHTGIHCDSPIISDLRGRVECCIDEAANAMKRTFRSVTLEDLWLGKIPFPAQKETPLL